MLERTQVFVDTSYLLASFYNSWDEPARAQLEIDLQEVCNVLDRIIVQHVGQPIQRQNWYDGIPDSGPHKYQRTLRTMDGVLLRAGLLIETGQRRTQKAVDTRLVADMVLAAVRQQCTDMVLVSGDQDMIPGVVEATNMGIRVHLLGFSWESMSTALRHKCDTVTILDPRDDFAECMQIQPLEGPIPPQIPPRVYSDETIVNRRIRTAPGEGSVQDGPLAVSPDGTSADSCASGQVSVPGSTPEGTTGDDCASGHVPVPGSAAENVDGASTASRVSTEGSALQDGAAFGSDSAAAQPGVSADEGERDTRAATAYMSPGEVAHRIHRAATAASVREGENAGVTLPEGPAHGGDNGPQGMGGSAESDVASASGGAPESAVDSMVGTTEDSQGGAPGETSELQTSTAGAHAIDPELVESAVATEGSASVEESEDSAQAAGTADSAEAAKTETGDDQGDSPRPSPAMMAEKVPAKPRPNPSMMAPRRRQTRRYFPLASEIWSSNGFQTPFDVGQQYATWWFHNVATAEDRDNAHTLSGGGLPPHVDRPLLQFACEVLHEYTLNDYQRVSLRDGFHTGIRAILISGVEPRVKDHEDDEGGRP